MNSLWLIITITGSAMLASHFAVQFQPSLWAQWFAIATVLMFGFTMLAALVGVLKYSQTLRSRVYYPFLICIVFVLMIPTARNKGLDARMAIFRQHLPEYEETVKLIRESKAVQSGVPGAFALPRAYRYLASKIEVDRRSDGTLHALFYYGRGIPNQHYAFLYSSTDRPGEWKGLARWPGVEKIQKNWYGVRD